MNKERKRIPSLTMLNNGEWRIGAWDMELMVGDRSVASKLFKIIRWTYRASKDLSEKVNRGLGAYIKPEAITEWQSRFKQQVGELRADEKSLLDRFYKSSVWFTDIGLLYARWAEEV
jgi:hypothetical protein